jgi:hypothetical protein
MPKIKMKKAIEYNTIVPRPKDRTPKGQLIVGKQFEVKKVAPVKMKKK